jgi:hypothetical protein
MPPPEAVACERPPALAQAEANPPAIASLDLGMPRVDGYERGVGRKDDQPAVSEAWKNPQLTSYFTTPVAVGTEHLYFVTGTPPGFGGTRTTPRADLHCVEVATGKVLWTHEKVGRYHAGLLRTGDGKLLMLEDQGDLVLLDPSPKGYRELARSKVCGATWAHPGNRHPKRVLPHVW